PGRALRGTLGPPLGEQLDRPVERERLDRLAAPKACIRLTVRDVAAEASLLHDDRATAGRVWTKFTQGRLRGTPRAPRLRLREHAERFVQRDREQLLLALERASLRSLADERPVPPVHRHDLVAVS